MTHHEKLAEHLKKRPELPRPVPAVDSPAYQQWRKDTEKWLADKAKLEEALTPKVVLTRQQPEASATPEKWSRLNYRDL